MRQLLYFILASLLLYPTPLQAQATDADTANKTETAAEADTAAESNTLSNPDEEKVNREQVDELRNRIENAADLSEEDKKTALDFVLNAVNQLNAAKDLITRNNAAKENLTTVDEDRALKQSNLEEMQKPQGARQQVAELKAELDRYLVDLREQFVPREETTAQFIQYEQELALRKNTLLQTRAELDALEAQINSRSERQRVRKERLTAIPAEKEIAEQQISELPATPTTLIDEAKKLSLQAELQKLEVEPATIQLEIELSSAKEAATILQIERQIKSLEIDRLKQEIQLFTETLGRAREIDAANRRSDAIRLLEEAKNSEELPQKLLIDVYERNVSIIDDELAVQSTQKKLLTDLKSTEQDRASLSEEFEQIKSRSGRTGTSRSFGIRLRQQRSNLPSPTSLRARAAQEMLPYEEAQLKYFDLREERKKLDNLDEEVAQLMQKIINDPTNLAESGQDLSVDEVTQRNDRYAEIEQVFRKAFNQQRTYLTQLISAYDKYLQQLENLEAELFQFADLSKTIAEYIDERVLWIRSNDAISWNSLTTDFQSLKSIFDKEKWSIVLSCLFYDFWDHLFLYSLFLVIWSFLFATQSQQTERIKQTSKKAASRLNTSLKPTVQSTLMTFSKSCILPLPILFLSWRLYAGASSTTQFGEQTKNLYMLASNFLLVGFWLLTLEFVRNIHRPKGLAQSHFNWPESTCQGVTKQVRTFIFLVTPLIVLIAILNAWKAEGDSEILKRILAVGVFLLIAFSLRRLTDTDQGAISPWVEANENSWIEKFAALFQVVAFAVPSFLALLSWIGFSYTSDQLAMRLAETALLLFGILFLRAFFLRWLSLRHRRIAVEQARKTRAALADEEHQHDAVTRAVVNEAQEQKVVLAEVSAQTRRLLNTTLVVFVFLGVLLIWSAVLPALHYFDEINLPGTTVRIPALFSAVVLAILTATAARNLPGLMQITLLEWLPLEKSSRYAIAAITQYIIAIIGLLAISGQLSIGWDQVQWLAAALTFGLGFGLQEIFANFVAGIIILFEQPVRVGDVVTIDGVSGVVSRIRIRSTTITDWDRKEYIVPNREFITGKLLNWTLTDTTTRLTIPVGVAYGTDPKQVYEILRKTVDDHPEILKEPEPIITFDQFGDSSLNFTLRAFLPTLDKRLSTIHDLHIAIDNAFAEAGIEIPFPQRDLHIRSAVELPVVSSRAEADPHFEQEKHRIAGEKSP